MSTSEEQAAAAGAQVSYLDPPPPDYRQMLVNIYHILRGAQVAIQNPGMIPDHLHAVVYKGAVNGLVTYLGDELGFDKQENQLEVVLQAIGIQRAVRQKAGL